MGSNTPLHDRVPISQSICILFNLSPTSRVAEPSHRIFIPPPSSGTSHPYWVGRNSPVLKVERWVPVKPNQSLNNDLGLLHTDVTLKTREREARGEWLGKESWRYALQRPFRHSLGGSSWTFDDVNLKLTPGKGRSKGEGKGRPGPETTSNSQLRSWLHILCLLRLVG